MEQRQVVHLWSPTLLSTCSRFCYCIYMYIYIVKWHTNALNYSVCVSRPLFVLQLWSVHLCLFRLLRPFGGCVSIWVLAPMTQIRAKSNRTRQRETTKYCKLWVVTLLLHSVLKRAFVQLLQQIRQILSIKSYLDAVQITSSSVLSSLPRHLVDWTLCLKINLSRLHICIYLYIWIIYKYIMWWMNCLNHSNWIVLLLVGMGENARRRQINACVGMLRNVQRDTEKSWNNVSRIVLDVIGFAADFSRRGHERASDRERMLLFISNVVVHARCRTTGWDLVQLINGFNVFSVVSLSNLCVQYT